MKKIIPIINFCLIFFLLGYLTAHAGTFKWVRVGKFQTKIVDSGDQGESSGEATFHYYYYNKFGWPPGTDHSGYQIGTKNWTDENGNTFLVKISGAGHGTCDESTNTIPVPDNEGYTIKRYVRYQPPTVTVDGFGVNLPFPQAGDEVNPDKIPGTADVMIESWINTSMGLTIHQRVLAWSQTNHDDYMIWDWTFINTGNVDSDADIELPNQTLEDIYFARANNFYAGADRPWHSCFGEVPGDSIRISYAYPARSGEADYDDFGDPDLTRGFLNNPMYIGEAMLHVDKSASDHSDDLSQPQWTASHTAELLWIKNEANINSTSDHSLLYQTMQTGFDDMPMMSGTYPGTHHNMRMDEMAINQDVPSPIDFAWWNWRACTYTASGPYTLAPGDSFRIVWATVYGSIAPEKGWEVGKAWLNGEATWEGENNLPEVHEHFGHYDDDNDYAKDCWVATGKDSLFNNAWAAKWAVEHDYNVPIPPPAPSVEIQSLPDGVKVMWGDESEAVSDFAGYRVYRGIGDPDTTYLPVFECGDGTANSLTHEFIDRDAQRGVAYFYYVAAFDDGVENVPGVKGIKQSLESGKYLNRTTKAAYLTRPEGSLSEARVVPNPFNINAKDLQFPGEPDKIMFFNIPGVCTIKIYTESGDLIKTIEHTDGSGDESWGNLLNEHSATDTGQIIVSGLYIAHIETPSGKSVNLKFLVVR